MTTKRTTTTKKRSAKRATPKAARPRAPGRSRRGGRRPGAHGRPGSGLAEYRRKRDFNKNGRAAWRAGTGRTPKLAYVIQRHAASQFHYDLRLELDGVMKSWAVPKGPSLDPAVKRLAMEVEDHPIEYNKFEGTIPKGEYGGGTVMIWDRGTYTSGGAITAIRSKGYAGGTRRAISSSSSMGSDCGLLGVVRMRRRSAASRNGSSSSTGTRRRSWFGGRGGKSEVGGYGPDNGRDRRRQEAAPEAERVSADTAPLAPSAHMESFGAAFERRPWTLDPSEERCQRQFEQVRSCCW